MELNPAVDIIDSSKIADYLMCPRYYMYRHVLGWDSEYVSNHLIFGGAWHLAMKHLLDHGYSAETIVQAYALFEAEYRRYFTEDTDEVYFPKTPTVVFNALANYVKQYADNDCNLTVLHTEVAGSVPLLNGQRIHFRVDSICKDRDDLILSLEHKTTKSFSRQWRDQFKQNTQTGTYNHVLHCLYPPEQVKGIVINGAAFQSGIKKAGRVEFERVPVYRSAEMMQDWLVTTTSIAEEISKQLMLLREYDNAADEPVLRLFRKNTESCTDYFGCKYMDFCLAWANPLQHCTEVPIGMMQRYWDPTEEEVTASKVVNL